jgi:DHA2 family multidrug resistance protein-like MFS transporter
VTALGLALSGVGLLVVTQVDPSAPGLLVLGLVLAAFGISFPMALTMNLMMAAAPPEKAGSAASVSETSGEFGIAVGIATLGSLGTLVYRSVLDLPAGTPDDVAAAAKGSLTAAITVGRDVPGLLDAARAAFTSGLNVVGVVGAVIFVGLALTAAITLRTRARVEEPVDEPERVPA